MYEYLLLRLPAAASFMALLPALLKKCLRYSIPVPSRIGCRCEIAMTSMVGTRSRKSLGTYGSPESHGLVGGLLPFLHAVIKDKWSPIVD